MVLIWRLTRQSLTAFFTVLQDDAVGGGVQVIKLPTADRIADGQNDASKKIRLMGTSM